MPWYDRTYSNSTLPVETKPVRYVLPPKEQRYFDPGMKGYAKMSRRRRGGYGIGDFARGVSDVFAPYMTVDNAKRAYDMGRSIIPEKYRGYTDMGRSMFGKGRAPRAKKRPSEYNLLVSSVVKDKFAGDPQALPKAVSYIKQHNLFQGGRYIKGTVGQGRSGGRRSGGAVWRG